MESKTANKKIKNSMYYSWSFLKAHYGFCTIFFSFSVFFSKSSSFFQVFFQKKFILEKLDLWDYKVCFVMMKFSNAFCTILST